MLTNPAALFAAAVVVVIAAAARSTWSPCGWSMLSTITPISERGRGHRFGATAAWFVGGAVVGGVLLGTLAAGGAEVVALLELTSSTRLALGGVVAIAAGALDARLLRPALPHHRRQVNEDWLDEFRPWVYAAGFGLQIGSGLATYIMTGGVYAVVALGALSGSWSRALVLGTSFGLARGLAVLAGGRNTDPVRLGAFHRRFDALDDPARRAVAIVLSVTGAAALVVAAGAPGIVALTVPATALVGAAIWALGASRQADSTLILPSATLSNATELERRSSEPTTA